MKFTVAAATLFAGLAAARNATISGFNYNSVNGYPIISFNVDATDNSAGINCVAENFVPGQSFPCSDPSWIVTPLESQGHFLLLTQTLNSHVYEGNFTIAMNGPNSAVLDQIGDATAEMVESK